ncbi:MAG: diguanylate cyclase [Gammaproteobacteria bacterium]|jgi:diguanylate cyclase (GGDEF)-like protein
MPAGNPETPLCDQLGFDAEWRRAQLLLVDLEQCPDELVGQLHERVLARDAAEQTVDRFFEQLKRQPQAAELLSSFDLRHLKERQLQFFKEFGVGCNAAGYFESRARVGMMHARVGVPLSLYLSAFGLLQSLLLDVIAERIEDEAGRQALGRLVMRLTTLDIALATEIYHRVQTADPAPPARHRLAEQGLLRRQLEQDGLTGVSSRTSLLHELQHALKRAAKTGQPLCLVLADLDHFKVINDTHGHAVGDRVLKEVASRLTAVLREFDVVGRFGGEEFVIVLENTSRHTAWQVAERMRLRIASGPLGLAGKELHLTISQGVAMGRDGDDSHGLLRRADAAMHRAKEQGRNCIADDLDHAARG